MSRKGKSLNLSDKEKEVINIVVSMSNEEIYSLMKVLVTHKAIIDMLKAK